jgi:predicted nucleotidyltransferase
MIANEVRESLQKVCSILNKNKVEYIVVGGVAVGYHGYRRISGISMYKPEMKTDLDFWYRSSIENFTKLIKALEDLGVKNESLKKIVFDPKKTFLKIPHTNFHTDFLPTMLGLDSFQESKRDATKETLDGNDLYILSYNDLIKNKLAVGRNIDKEDIKELDKVKKNSKRKGLSI